MNGALTGHLSDSGPTSSPSKWRFPKCYTMIIPPMGGDHVGMSPGAQRSAVAKIAIPFFFIRFLFCSWRRHFWSMALKGIL